MKKIVIDKPGGLERLQIRSFPDPVPDDNEVVVKAHSIGVNYADIIIRMGYYASAKQYVGWPITPGFDFAGEVIATGKSVKNFKTGDRVLGVSRFNSYATHVTVPENQIFSIPDHFSYQEAGGFPTIFLTAYYALHMSTQIYPGSKILVHSAAGGVGSALLQLCTLQDWTTIGVVGNSAKVDFARDMGADRVIDKSAQNLWQMVDEYAPDGLDVVLDSNGALTIKKGYNRLRENGKLICYGFHGMFQRGWNRANIFRLAYQFFRTPRFSPLSMNDKNRTVIAFNLSFLFHRADLLEFAMTDLMNWYTGGKIKMPAVTAYAFEDVASAHRDMQSGKTTGKLVLVPEDYI